MLRAVEQGPKKSKNQFKIEKSNKTFGYSVKFDVRKKKGEHTMHGFYRYVILWPRSDLEKNLAHFGG